MTHTNARSGIGLRQPHYRAFHAVQPDVGRRACLRRRRQVDVVLEAVERPFAARLGGLDPVPAFLAQAQRQTGVAVAARGDGIVVAVSVGNGVDVGAVVGDGVMVGSFVGDGAVVAKGRGVAVVALSSVGRLTVAGGRPSSAWIR